MSPSAVAGLRALKSHLLELQAKGRTHIQFSEETRLTLASLPGRAKTAPARPAAVVAETTPVRPAPATASPPAQHASPGGIVPEGATKTEKLDYLRNLVAHCERSGALESLRDTMVFAVGNPDADLMFVGEAPGADEEAQGEPFVGKAGQLLTKIIQAMGLKREDVYISNIVKYRPAMPDQGYGNRKPTSPEMEACLPYVLAEIDVVQPKAVVALGATAAEGLLGLTESVGRMRAHFHELAGIPVMVTYHPSYLLRNGAISEKRKVWEDMLLVMEKLGIPISEKQQAFFLKK